MNKQRASGRKAARSLFIHVCEHEVMGQNYEKEHDAFSADIEADSCFFEMTVSLPCKIGKLLIPAPEKALDETEAVHVQSV